MGSVTPGTKKSERDKRWLRKLSNKELQHLLILFHTRTWKSQLNYKTRWRYFWALLLLLISYRTTSERSQTVSFHFLGLGTKPYFSQTDAKLIFRCEEKICMLRYHLPLKITAFIISPSTTWPLNHWLRTKTYTGISYVTGNLKWSPEAA